MAKGKKKKKKSTKPSISTETNPEMILKKAEELSAAGNFARAREGFRRLFKLEPEIYRKSYIEVTQAAIKTAISDGKNTQARQWLDYLKTELKVGPEELKLEELMLAKALGDESATESLARAQLDSEDEMQRLHGADALVLAQAPEAEAICQAIGHLCKSEWAKLSEALQAVGRKSPFAHWRLFLRGCAAYYQHDATLAKSCFSKLPAGTIPRRKAEAFADWHVADAKNLPDSAFTEACSLVGEPKMAAAILKSEAFWRKNQYLKAYESMKGSGAKFPEIGVSLAGQLTRFFQRADASLDHTNRARWLDFASKIMSNRRFNSKADDYVLTNSLIHGVDYQCDAIWEIYMKSRAAMRGESARFHALCYVTRATIDLLVNCDCPECVEYSNEHAVKSLKLAIKADPDYEPAYLKMLDSYQKLGKKSERNKLLDEMGERFPESKTALLAAGRACLDRKAYQKGLNYLEKAQKASPLDSEVSAEIRRGLMGKALDHYKKGTPPQVTKARETFDLLLESTPRQSSSAATSHFTETQDFVLLRWSVLEDLCVKGKDCLNEEKRAQAEGIDAHVAEFFMALHRESYSNQLPGKKVNKRPQLKLSGSHTPSQAWQMLQILLHFAKSEDTKDLSRAWFTWMEHYLDDSLSTFTKNDREIAINLVRLLNASYSFWEYYPDPLIDRWLKIDRSDPLFLVWHWRIEDELPSPKILEKIRQEAGKRGDRKALAELDSLIKDFDDDESFGVDPFGPIFDEKYDQDDDDFLDDGAINPSDIAAMCDELKGIPTAERIRRLIENGLPPKEAETMSTLIDVLNNAGIPLGGSAKKKSSKRTSDKSKNEPNQDEFPF